MEKYYTEIIIGIAMLLSSFLLTFLGISFQNLWTLVIAMSLSLAGAMIGIRGLIEFLTKVFKNKK